jgi:hypothetical protein
MHNTAGTDASRMPEPLQKNMKHPTTTNHKKNHDETGADASLHGTSLHANSGAAWGGEGYKGRLEPTECVL